MLVYLPENGEVLLKSYSSTTRGARGILKIELEFTDLRELGWQLSELGVAQAKQKSDMAARKKGAARGTASPTLQLPSPEAYE